MRILPNMFVRSFAMIAVVLSLTGCDLFEGQIEQDVVNWAVANYAGTCACPFSAAPAGGLCGSASAWSTGAPGAPICYASEVTQAMINAYLASR